MSFDRELDKKINQIETAVGKGINNFGRNVAVPFFYAVQVGLKEFFSKKYWRTKRFLASLLFIFLLSVAAGYAESLYLSPYATEYKIVDWLYNRQQVAPYPVGLLVCIAGILVMFKNYGKAQIELRERFLLAFERAGLYSKRKVDSSHEYPVLYRDGSSAQDDSRFFIFKSPGLSLENWVKSKDSLEATLQQKISSITLYKYNPGMIQIILGGEELPTFLEYSEELAKHGNSDSSVVVGVSSKGPVIHDFKEVPHLLAGGATGAGKTVVVSQIAYQCIEKLKGILYIIDFKGGADYADFEELGISIISERPEVASLLKSVVTEHKKRVGLFRENKVKNIWQYNQKFPNKPLRRIFVLIDELAELTDSKGLSKEESDLVEIVIGFLSRIARLTRSTGINLILGTQRPDANVVPGQIKNNVTGRLCGYFNDDVAYRIVLDFTPDPRLPSPDDQKGRFIYSTGAAKTLIQTPLFESRHIDPTFKMDYESGVLTYITFDPDVDLFDDEDSPVPSKRSRYFNIHED